MLAFDEFAAVRRRQTASMEALMRERKEAETLNEEDDEALHEQSRVNVDEQAGEIKDEASREGQEELDDVSDLEDEDILLINKAGVLMTTGLKDRESKIMAARSQGRGREGSPSRVLLSTESLDENTAIEDDAKGEGKAATSAATSSKKANVTSSKPRLSEGKRDNKQQQQQTTETVSTSSGVAAKKHAVNKAAAGGKKAKQTILPMLARLGVMVETYEVQVTMIALIFLDIVITVMLTLMDQGKDPWATQVKGSMSHTLRVDGMKLMESLSALILLASISEIFLLFIAFGSRPFGHLGYLTDLAILFLFLYADVGDLFGHNLGREIRFLSLFRVWRVFRLVNTILAGVEAKHQITKDALEAEKRRAEELRLEVIRKKEAMEREKEARRRLNDMLQGYKDEVETLNEALRIAALDVALVANESGSEEEDDDDDEEGHHHQHTSTIFVHEDGTYEIK